MRKLKALLILVLFVFLASACVSEESATQGDARAGLPKADTSRSENRGTEPVPVGEALSHPGDIGGGRYALPNGRFIQPAGTQVGTASFPIDVAVSPDGATAVVGTAKHAAVYVVDVASGNVTDILSVTHSFSGAIFNATGDKVYISGGASHKIHEFTMAGGIITQAKTIEVHNMPSGLALSPDGTKLYAACYLGKRVAVVNLLAGIETASYPAHLFAYDVKISPDGQTAYVSNQGPNSVSVLDLTAGGEEIAEIPVGANPEMMALSPDGGRLYVANSDSDEISVIDTSTLQLADTFMLHPEADAALGASPVAVEVSADGSRLYVTAAGYNSVDVLDAGSGDVLGRVPTGWYPTNTFLDEAHGRLFVTNGKGNGSAGLGLWDDNQGTLSIVDLPDDTELAAYTQQADAGTRFATTFFDLSGEIDSPIPTVRGVPSEQIKHVVFVLRENKTFDQMLAELEGVEADQAYLEFGEDNIPNAYALARAYTVADNAYAEGDTSVLGHLWASYSIVNDHAEKAYDAGGIYPLPDMDADTRPPSGTIFKSLLDHGIPFRSYGQIIGLANDLDRFGPYMDFKYGFWNMGVWDVTKVEEIFREINAGIFEPFTYLLLPNDHTYGSKSGAPTAQFLVGDNDAGLGKLVEFFSHRDDWIETAIFIIEDDPQSGRDHVDPHRVPVLVISPWAKKHYVSSVLYSQASIWATIEMILGLPPLTQYDQFASPMYDAFTMTPDTTPYTAIPNPIPFQENAIGLPMQDYCDRADFSTPDGVPRLGEVLWALTHPGRPWPVDYAVTEPEEEEEAEAEIYRDGLKKALAYAKKHRLEVGGYEKFKAED